MMYTVIQASSEQVSKLYEKHCKPGLFNIPKIITKTFSYDDEDDIGFVTLFTISGKKIEYQLRNDEPCFIEFSGFGNIRYDISYPKKINNDLYDILKKYGIKAKENFWKGSQI